MKIRQHSGRLVAAAAVTAVLLVAATLAVAQPAGHRHGPGEPGEFLDHLTRRLDLTDDQRATLAGLFASHREVRMTEREQLQAARDTLDEQVHADVFDEGAIRAAAAELAALGAERAVARARLLQEVRGVLTPDQMEQFQEMMSWRRERMGRHFDGPPHHGGQEGRRGR